MPRHALLMARKPRIHVAGGIYHVMLRGNGGQDIFFTDEDRCRFYLLLQEGTERFGYRVHGFCLMGNHVHLALQAAETALAKPMQNLSFRYTRWVNKRQRRIGHLFQGRYKAILVERDSYLVELVRYIHLNPVRAGMVRDAEEYSWSGQRAYLGEEVLPWCTTEWVLKQFGKTRRSARRRYQRFIEDGVNGGHDDRFHGGETDTRVLGADRFLEQVLGSAAAPRSAPPGIDTITLAVCRAYRMSPEQLAAPGRSHGPAQARALVALLAMQTGAATLTEVGRRFGRDVSTLSTGVRRLSRRIRVGTDTEAPWQRPTRRYNIKL